MVSWVVTLSTNPDALVLTRGQRRRGLWEDFLSFEVSLQFHYLNSIFKAAHRFILCETKRLELGTNQRNQETSDLGLTASAALLL